MRKRTETSAPDTPARIKPARVFFALWPDAGAVQRLHDLAGTAHAICDGRRMRRDTLHLTLAFIGDVARERVADLIAAGDRVHAAAFTLTLDRIAAWRHNRIVWAGAKAIPDALSDLFEQLTAAVAEAGFPLEPRKFAPHVTLLRNARADLPGGEIDPPIEWRVRRFVLVESDRRDDGSHYDPLESWALDSAPKRQDR